MTEREHREFSATKLVVERVHRRLGIRREYLSRDWLKDEQVLRESVRRKQAPTPREQEAALVAAFEAWRHGQRLESN